MVADRRYWAERRTVLLCLCDFAAFHRVVSQVHKRLPSLLPPQKHTRKEHAHQNCGGEMGVEWSLI